MTLPAFSRRQRYVLLAISVGILLWLGFGIASRINLATPVPLKAPASRELVIAELTLGTPLDPAERVKKNPKLRQAPAYTTADPLALRVTTEKSVTRPFTVSVRLLTPAGNVVELTPSQVTLAPGTSAFCCWQVEQAGTYTLQIFRPEKVITSLPLLIEQAITRPTPLR